MSRTYTYEQAAQELQVKVPWLQRNIRRLPHSKFGRAVRFTRDDLDRILTICHQEPDSGPLAPDTNRTPAIPPALANLRPLSPRRRRASAS